MRIYDIQSYARPVGLMSLLFVATAHFSSAQVPSLEIWQIQGNGNVSPYEGDVVRAPENIVTAVGDQFFYMQTPPARADQDPNTSDALMVYTGFSPGVRPGDLVTVTGRVRESDGQTQFGAEGITVSVVNTRQPAPDPVIIDGRFPGLLPKPTPDLEQVEGMLVQITGTTTGPSDERGWFPVRGGAERAFREPGIRYPGMAGLPVWDGNPEVFWIDPDALGVGDNRRIPGGTPLRATAILSQSGGDYLALPLAYALETGAGLRAVREKKNGEITVASINARQLVFGAAGYAERVKKLAGYVQQLMRGPDIVAVQEVGSKRVLDDLTAQLNLSEAGAKYGARLVAGESDLQIGFLIRENLPVLRVVQLGEEERLSVGGRLHDRPPLLLEVRLPGEASPVLRLLNVHLRSLNGIEGADANFVRLKRQEQALSVSRMIQEWRDENLLVLGDFNAFEFSDGYVDVVNQIQGTSSAGALFPMQSIVQPPLQNLTIDFQVPVERYSYVFNGDAQLLDHCLRNEWRGLAIEELTFVRGNADQPEVYFGDFSVLKRVSDHDGFVLFLCTDATVPIIDPYVLPIEIRLPNPIAGGQAFECSLPHPGNYRLTIVDTLGRVASTFQGAGDRLWFRWPENLPSGWYVLSVETAQGRGWWKVMSR